MSLVGKFVFHDGGNYHRTGEIVDQVTPYAVLIKWHAVTEVPGSRPGDLLTLIPIMTMADIGGDSAVCWQFYNTRAELDEFAAWMEASSEATEPEVRTFGNKPQRRSH
jgi:hypothetical protein